jgi:disulfide oxidoreductase YuzD
MADKYKLAGEIVDGRYVLGEIPNVSSIDASLANYRVLDGIRIVPFSAFTMMGPIRFYSVDEEQRTTRLAEEILESREINPLIVVEDAKGPYVLEGGHRFDALRLLKAKAFPALVVLDLESLKNPMNNEINFEGGIYKVGLSYKYKDLPSTAQEDARNSASTEDDPEGENEAKKYMYELVVIPNAKAKNVAEEISRKINISRWSVDRVKELADDIATNGLGSPPTGAEGFHRLLALVSLGDGVPYFRMVKKKTGRGVGGAFFP